MKSFKAQLLDATPAMDDIALAATAANAAVESERLPYCFSIDHNIGAPKFAACKLKYDFTWGKTVGIETSDKRVAASWIASALVLGYTVTRAGHRTQGVQDRAPYGEAWSLSRIRERAARHQAPKPENDDDDIPF